jgi:ABC-2 type transport system permease protein
MRNIWTIARREYRQYFTSPIAYVIALGILFVTGAYFVLYFYLLSQPSPYGAPPAPDASIVIQPMAIIFLFGIPALTMRLLADEQRSGTMELLLTSPLRDGELVTGKWLGSFLFALTIIAMTLIFPFILNFMITPGIDPGIALAGYLVLTLMVGALLALGTAMSAVFSNQFAAFFVTLVIILILWWVIGWPASVFQQYEGVAHFFKYLNINTHLSTWTDGTVTLEGIAYFLSLISFGLLIGTAAVEMRRWK